MLTISKQELIKMGAIDPITSRYHAKIKSASVESANQLLDLKDNCSKDYYGNKKNKFEEEIGQQATLTPANRYRQSIAPIQNEGDTKTLLRVAPISLKPSLSTSCLFSAEDTGSSNALVCIPTRASLTHEWKKLKTPNKCRECNVLVYFNGRECSFCGFVAHKKCVTILVIKCSGQRVARASQSENRRQQQDCTNNKQQVNRKIKPIIKPVFGQPISGADSLQVVDFMRRFIYEIDTRGLATKGIYRVSSIKSKVDKLCNYYDQNLSSLIDLSSFHPNIIANALKMYLRQLPEPLLTHDLYESFIEIAKKYSNFNTNSNKAPAQSHQVDNNDRKQQQTPRQRRPYSVAVTSNASSSSSVYNNPAYDPMLIVELTEIIDQLPPINKKLIAIIMRHLKRVSDMADENQMSSKNLSIIFGPTLLNADNESLAIVDNIHQARVVELLINWADQVFPLYENYNSEAVIELNYTNSPLEEFLDAKIRSAPEKTSESFTKNIIRNLTSKPKDNKKAKQEKETNKVEKNDLVKPTETREDLRELRRQFFTMTSVQTESMVNDNYCPSPTPESPTGAEKFNNLAVSVPMIEIQPYQRDAKAKFTRKGSGKIT